MKQIGIIVAGILFSTFGCKSVNSNPDSSNLTSGNALGPIGIDPRTVTKENFKPCDIAWNLAISKKQAGLWEEAIAALEKKGYKINLNATDWEKTPYVNEIYINVKTTDDKEVGLDSPMGSVTFPTIDEVCELTVSFQNESEDGGYDDRSVYNSFYGRSFGVNLPGEYNYCKKAFAKVIKAMPRCNDLNIDHPNYIQR